MSHSVSFGNIRSPYKAFNKAAEKFRLRSSREVTREATTVYFSRSSHQMLQLHQFHSGDFWGWKAKEMDFVVKAYFRLLIGNDNLKPRAESH